MVKSTRAFLFCPLDRRSQGSLLERRRATGFAPLFQLAFGLAFWCAGPFFLYAQEMKILGLFLVVLGVSGFVWPATKHTNAGNDHGLSAVEIAISLASVGVMFIGLLLRI